MKDNKSFLGTEPIRKLLFKLAVPTVTAQIINLLYNIVDRVYIGHIKDIGPLALTGVGVCLPIIMIITAFSALISNGGAPRASIFMGENRYDLAEKTLGNCFSLQVVASIVMTVILMIYNKPILMTFGASLNTITYATDYMNIYALGTIFVQLTMGMNSFITAQGFTKISMLAIVIGAVINIILDPIFIFGLGMGVKGAALATIISQSVSCAWVIHFLVGKNTTIKIRKCNFPLKREIILPSLALGLSGFIIQASESLIAVCFNSSLLKYGGDIAVGAMTILTSVTQLSLLPLSGIGQGAQPIISFNYGAGHAERVRDTFRLFLKVNMVYASLFWALLMTFPDTFARIFTSNTHLIDYTAHATRIYGLALILFGVLVACQITLNALGNAKASIMIAVTRKIILLVPLIYILPNILSINKANSVYLAEPISDIISVTFAVLLFRHEFKKHMLKMQQENV